MAEKKLSERERRFVEAYMGQAQGNATKAAELAGYSVKSAGRIGFRLSKKVHIQAAIGLRQDKLSEKTGVTAERVIAELGLIAFSDIRGLFDEHGKLRPINELPEDIARTLASVEVSRERIKVRTADKEEITTEEALVKVRSWDKVQALQLLARKFGLLHDKVDHKHTFSLEDVLEASRSVDG